MKVYSCVCRPAADLLATVAINTMWVPCFGARAVIFEWRATNNATLQNAGVQAEATNSDPPVAGGPGLTGTTGMFTAPLPAVAGVDLSVRGGLRCYIAPSSPLPFLMQRAIHMGVLGNATLTITGLSCIAYVVYDGDEGDDFAPTPFVAT